MPNICRACNHPQRQQLEMAIAMRSDSKRAIAERFGLSKSSLQRHVQEHPDPKAAALAVKTTRLSLDEIIAQVSDNQRVMIKARDTEQQGVNKAKIGREVRENAAMLARLEGLLKDGRGTIDNRTQNLIIARELDKLTVDELRALLPGAEADGCD